MVSQDIARQVLLHADAIRAKVSFAPFNEPSNIAAGIARNSHILEPSIIVMGRREHYGPLQEQGRRVVMEGKNVTLMSYDALLDAIGPIERSRSVLRLILKDGSNEVGGDWWAQVDATATSGTGGQIWSRSAGEFEFSQPGNYEISIPKIPGYASVAKQSVVVSRGVPKTQVIDLQPER
jgi:hypothetical protein